MEDSEIVDLFLKRDEKAIQYTSDKYGVKLRRIAENILSDYHTAEECENDTYLNTWNLIPPNEPRTYFFTFLARIIRYKAIDRIKQKMRQKRYAEFIELTNEIESCIPSPGDVESKMDAKTLSDIVGRFLKGINKEKRILFIRRYWFMDSIKDIATHYSLTEGRVKTTLFRTRNELKAYLEKEGYIL